MTYKAYYHRFGGHGYEEFETLEEAIEFIQDGSAMGELFGDCIVDGKNIIVHDFDAETSVIGRVSPENRIGKEFKE